MDWFRDNWLHAVLLIFLALVVFGFPALAWSLLKPDDVAGWFGLIFVVAIGWAGAAFLVLWAWATAMSDFNP